MKGETETMADDKGRRIGFNILLALCSASIGFGASQMTLASEVHVSTAKVEANRKELDDVRIALREERASTDARIFELTGLMKEQIRNSTELITLIRVQKQIKEGQ